MGKIIIKCRSVMRGFAEGEALVTNQPISFWGGLDPKSGLIVDKRHELWGKNVSGKILIFPYGRGSVSGTTVLLEAIRYDKAPKAIINIETEPIIAVAAVLAEKIYGKTVPIVDRPEVNPIDFIKTDDVVKVDATEGIIEVKSKCNC
jgi:predicted aconitase with swiveling domain